MNHFLLNPSFHVLQNRIFVFLAKGCNNILNLLCSTETSNFSRGSTHYYVLQVQIGIVVHFYAPKSRCYEISNARMSHVNLQSFSILTIIIEPERFLECLRVIAVLDDVTRIRRLRKTVTTCGHYFCCGGKLLLFKWKKLRYYHIRSFQRNKGRIFRNPPCEKQAFRLHSTITVNHNNKILICSVLVATNCVCKCREGDYKAKQQTSSSRSSR